MENFYEAFINCEHTALGRHLKPFSLKHCLYLEAIGSPVMKLINGDEAEIARQDLEVAVIVCSSDDVINELKRPHWLMNLYSFKRGLTAFLSYLTDFVAVPELWDKSDSETTLNAPWILSRATLLLSKTNLTLGEIWDMPLGELLWYCASFAEQEGLGQIQSEEEKKMILEAERIKNGLK